ncbi:MAG: nucleotidyltransferase domain-containing protein [archaeon]
MNQKGMGRLNEILKELEKMGCVSSVFFFGSRSRGKARQDSDYDLAVITKDATIKEELKILGMGDETFNISVFSRLPLIIKFRVLKEGKLMFCKDKTYLYNTRYHIFKEYLDFQPFIHSFYRRVLTNV